MDSRSTTERDLAQHHFSNRQRRWGAWRGDRFSNRTAQKLTDKTDQSVLYLSTDDNPANVKLIAAETPWSRPRQYGTSAGLSDLTAKRSDQYAGSQWPTPRVITLTAGQPYYAEALMKQGGGADNLSVSIDGVSPIAGGVLVVV